jgi:4'-phosphopantetheinyl transferase
MWHLQLELPPLLDQTVHIWCVRLDVRPERVQWLVEILAADEQERAARFRFAHLRRRFVVARATVRQLLALYLGTIPSRLRFRYGTFGKPSLDEIPNGMPLSFNVAHSAELALIAVARGRDVGVDVERVRAVEDADAIAERYFCAPERDALRQSRGESKTALFFTYWTRKEAILKATGEGLSLPLDRVDVSTILGERPQTVSVLDGSGAPRQLGLIDLRPAIGYSGALAAERADWRFAYWRWPDGREINGSIHEGAQLVDR